MGLLYARQRLMKMPTDPKEIHRRADLIRERLKAEKRLARLEAEERGKLKENLDLIDFDMRMRQR